MCGPCKSNKRATRVEGAPNRRAERIRKKRGEATAREWKRGDTQMQWRGRKIQKIKGLIHSTPDCCISLRTDSRLRVQVPGGPLHEAELLLGPVPGRELSDTRPQRPAGAAAADGGGMEVVGRSALWVDEDAPGGPEDRSIYRLTGRSVGRKNLIWLVGKEKIGRSVLCPSSPVGNWRVGRC